MFYRNDFRQCRKYLSVKRFGKQNIITESLKFTVNLKNIVGNEKNQL